MLILGNIIALIAALVMVYTGYIKNKKKILYFQSIQIVMQVASNIILGGITGAITNSLCLVRNILCYNDKLNIISKIIITILSVILSLKFNNLGLLGYLPLIATTAYLWFMNTKSIVGFKFLMIFNEILWTVYDIVIKSYTSTIFDILTIIFIINSLIKIYKVNKAKKQIKN